MSIELVKALRANPTEAEKRLWRLLYPFRTGGFHFRKQAQIGCYYVDFVCHHALLVIEVDGDQHGTANGTSRDEVRDRYLNERGYRVLRFSNRDVLANPEAVFSVVAEELAGVLPLQHMGRPLPNPPHKEEGENEASQQPDITVGVVPPSSTLPLVGRVGEGVLEAHANEGGR